MSSLVKKIQQLALDSTISCTQLLNTTYYFSKKIQDSELLNLCKQEIFGYSNVSNVPQYRFIPVKYRIQNINGKIIPLNIPFTDECFAFLEKLPIKESIGELCNKYDQCKEDYLFLAIPQELQTALNQLSDYPYKDFIELRVFAIFSKEQIIRITNTLKMEILNKIIEIGNRGIDIMDDLFDEDNINENISISIMGDVNNSFLGNIKKNEIKNIPSNNLINTYDYAEAAKILKDIQKQYKKVKINRTQQKKVSNDIKQIKKAIREKNDTSIKNGFEDIKNLFIGITENIIAAGIVAVIKGILGA